MVIGTGRQKVADDICQLPCSDSEDTRKEAMGGEGRTAERVAGDGTQQPFWVKWVVCVAFETSETLKSFQNIFFKSKKRGERPARNYVGESLSVTQVGSFSSACKCFSSSKSLCRPRSGLL